MEVYYEKSICRLSRKLDCWSFKIWSQRGSIEMTDEEFEEFKQNPEEWLSEKDIDLELLVDDWEIDDYDKEIEDVHWEVK